MTKTQPQTDRTKSVTGSATYLKEIYNTNKVENIETNMDFVNGYDVFKNSKNITNNDNNKHNNNGDKKIVKCFKCFTCSPSKIGMSLNRPSRPSLPPNMKFVPPKPKFEPDNLVNNNNAIQERKNQSFSPETQSGQILFVYNS